jgi:transposase
LTGPERDDDRRIISGIIHMLQSGGHWRDCPREYGPYTTIYNRFKSMGQARTLASDLRGLGQARQRFRGSVSGFYIDQSSSLCFRRKRGECSQAIGRSRGGHTTKIHALSDPLCRPVTFLLTPGQDADIAAAPAVLALAPAMDALLADKDMTATAFAPIPEFCDAAVLGLSAATRSRRLRNAAASGVQSL